MSELIVICWGMGIALSLVGIYGYKAKVLKTLGEYGSDDKEKGLPSNLWRQLQQYKKVCIENKLSLNWYKFMAACPFIGVGLLIGWIALAFWTESIK